MNVSLLSTNQVAEKMGQQHINHSFPAPLPPSLPPPPTIHLKLLTRLSLTTPPPLACTLITIPSPPTHLPTLPLSLPPSHPSSLLPSLPPSFLPTLPPSTHRLSTHKPKYTTQGGLTTVLVDNSVQGTHTHMFVSKGQKLNPMPGACWERSVSRPGFSTAPPPAGCCCFSCFCCLWLR